MKKLIAIFLCILLVGCSSNVSAPLTTPDTSSQDEENTTQTNTSEESTEEEISYESYSQDILDYYYGTVIPEDAIDVIMHTNMGDIKLRLFPSEAPLATENFITHAKNGYYDGITFHRIIQDFMIQGGDPTATGSGGESIWQEGFATEFNGKLYHFYGAISMANTGQPNTNGSQFFIVSGKQTDVQTAKQLIDYGWPSGATQLYEEVSGTYHLDGQHPVFGYVFEGMDIVEEISQVETSYNDQPVEDVIIESIEIIE